jgi:integral membrane sensor domain MASE1
MKPIKYLKSWSIFTLIAVFGGMFAGGIIGAILGVILGASGVPIKTIPIITGGVGFIIGLPISFLTYRWSIDKYIIQPLLAERDSGIPPII